MLCGTVCLSKTCSAAFKVTPASRLRGPGPRFLRPLHIPWCREGRPDARASSWQYVCTLAPRDPLYNSGRVGLLPVLNCTSDISPSGLMQGLLRARPTVGRDGWLHALPIPCRPAIAEQGSGSRDCPPGRVRHTDACQRLTELEGRCELHEGESHSAAEEAVSPTGRIVSECSSPVFIHRNSSQRPLIFTAPPLLLPVPQNWPHSKLIKEAPGNKAPWSKFVRKNTGRSVKFVFQVNKQ